MNKKRSLQQLWSHTFWVLKPHVLPPIANIFSPRTLLNVHCDGKLFYSMLLCSFFSHKAHYFIQLASLSVQIRYHILSNFWYRWQLTLLRKCGSNLWGTRLKLAVRSCFVNFRTCIDKARGKAKEFYLLDYFYRLTQKSRNGRCRTRRDPWGQRT